MGNLTFFYRRTQLSGRVRRQLVDELKEQRLFSKVDLLSDDLRRNLADPKVTIPDRDRDFVLTLDFAVTDFEQPPSPRKPLPGSPGRSIPRRALRPTPTPAEGGENPILVAP